MKHHLTAALCVALLASGCASTGPGSTSLPGFPPSAAAPAWTPTIDTRGVNQAKYQKEYAECVAFARADPDADGATAGKKKAMKWGLGGMAAAGALTVMTGGLAAIPLAAGTVATTGGALAFSGGYAGKTNADSTYRTIVATCLQGRGYTVLN